ncbi:MAG: Ni/Fe hydrogenase subunit alpha [Proteobacteria bacterium]|nr:Ni/Fe hydrogenase subunit alpha [Pseudomonadota bacterium]
MSSQNLSINVHHVTRVEGHGNIEVNLKKGIVEKCMWNVVEAPRFFEAFLQGRPYKDVNHITSRICGICSIGHQMASLKATEAAMGVRISEQTLLLRKLLLHGENLQSHVLHTYFLVAPDFFGVGSVFPLVQTHKDVVVRALTLKKLANDLCDVVGGRTVHPIRCKVGGFSCLPKPAELEQARARLEAARPEIDKTVDLFATLKIPAFERETEYIGLSSKTEYPLYEGALCSSDAGTFKDEDYLSVTNEYIVPQSTAKYTRHKRESYMVGALARFNLNYEMLHPKAKKAAAALNLKAPCHNPFMISVAQVVEIVDSLENGIALIDTLLARGLQEEEFEIKPKAGRGVGIVEVPRGILFHDYTYNEKGEIVRANCIIPTNQNHANIQKDMEKFLPMILDKNPDEIKLNLEMLVRAYDPCISCSTHYLDVTFIE